MKIIFLTRLYWPHVGGVERHVGFLSRELVGKGHKVTVVCEQHDEGLALREKHEGAKVVRLPYSARGNKIATWKWMQEQKKLFARADVVHGHDVYWWYFWMRWQLRGVASFCTFHGYTGFDNPKRREGWHRRLVSGMSRKTMAVGGFMKKWYGIEADEMTFGAAKVRKYPVVRSNTGVFVGRIEADTGLMVYLKALGLMKKKLSVDIYGDGSLRQQAEQFAVQEHLPVAFHGWKENVSGVYKEVRYAFCSQYLAILEAMQSKRLVLAVYTNEFKRDYLSSHPMYEHMVVAGNFTELAEKFNELGQDKEREMVEACYEWARKQTWIQLTNQYLNMWGV